LSGAKFCAEQTVAMYRWVHHWQFEFILPQQEWQSSQLIEFELQYFAMELKKQILLMQLKHKLIWKKRFY